VATSSVKTQHLFRHAFDLWQGDFPYYDWTSYQRFLLRVSFRKVAAFSQAVHLVADKCAKKAQKKRKEKKKK
jgi:hypothetical protein